jgi:hypothetical protein
MPASCPVRRRVQRRVNRARCDADQTVAAFAARLKDALDLDTVRGDLARVVQTALEPAPRLGVDRPAPMRSAAPLPPGLAAPHDQAFPGHQRPGTERMRQPQVLRIG